MTSPYLNADGERLLRPSVVCFLDILGFRSFFHPTVPPEAQARSLSEMHDALKAASGHFDWWKSGTARALSIEQPFVVKSFTDNVVIGWPIDDDGEIELGRMFDHVADFQFSLTVMGYFVRGAIAIGPAFIDELGAFGSGILEAHEGEAQLARDPRVVLMPSARSYVEQHLGYYPFKSHAPQNRVLKCDTDGQWFVDYLDSLIIEPEASGGVGYQQLEAHKNMIIAKLTAHADVPRYWAKYEWSARYHNHFCLSHSDLFDDRYLVPLDDARAQISRIIRSDNAKR